MKYAIPIFNYDNQIVGRYNLDFVSDEAAIVHAQAMLPPRGGKFEIWQGTRHVRTITCPNHQRAVAIKGRSRFKVQPGVMTAEANVKPDAVRARLR